MENPYASPNAGKEPAPVSGWVRAVRVVAILLVVQGVSECGASILLIYLWKKTLLSFSVSLLVFICGGVRIVAGVRNYQYRNRALGMVALCLAPVSLFTCLCLPSAILLMISGLFVYLNPDAELAFA